MIVVACVVFLLLSGVAGAEPVAVGESFAPIVLENQHGDPGRIDESARVILFSRDMDGGEFIKKALEEEGSAILERHHAVYVADISGMPSLVAQLFALPSLRKRPYPMLLDRDGSHTASLPDVEGKATLIFLDNLRVTGVEHVTSGESLLSKLEERPEDDPPHEDE